jgi:hypothetical protein
VRLAGSPSPLGPQRSLAAEAERRGQETRPQQRREQSGAVRRHGRNGGERGRQSAFRGAVFNCCGRFPQSAGAVTAPPPVRLVERCTACETCRSLTGPAERRGQETRPQQMAEAERRGQETRPEQMAEAEGERRGPAPVFWGRDPARQNAGASERGRNRGGAEAERVPRRGQASAGSGVAADVGLRGERDCGGRGIAGVADLLSPFAVSGIMATAWTILNRNGK